jgi:FtsH-binding integral membrane protein
MCFKEVATIMLGTIFSKLISMIMVLIFILSILMLVLTFRKPKKISLPSLAITLCISLLSMVVFSAIIGYSPSFVVWLLMALIGGTIGYIWAKTTNVYIESGQVKSQNSIWYLAVWGAVFALNQLITITTNRPPPIAMAMLVMSTFIVWGTNGNIIRRYFKLQPALAGQAASAPAMPAANSNPLYGRSNQGVSASANPADSIAQPALPDPFAEVATRYNKIKSDYDQGIINKDTFMHRLNELRLQDNQGNWWQIGEDGQSWLKWDGKYWI